LRAGRAPAGDGDDAASVEASRASRASRPSRAGVALRPLWAHDAGVAVGAGRSLGSRSSGRAGRAGRAGETLCASVSISAGRASLAVEPRQALDALRALRAHRAVGACCPCSAGSTGIALRTGGPDRADRAGGTGGAVRAGCTGRTLRAGRPGGPRSAGNAADAPHPVAEEVGDAIALPPGGAVVVLATRDDLDQPVVHVHADERPLEALVLNHRASEGRRAGGQNRDAGSRNPPNLLVSHVSPFPQRAARPPTRTRSPVPDEG